MDKEKIKKFINDIIDSADEIRNFYAIAETKEKPNSNNEYKELKHTGLTRIFITTYKRVD